MSEWEGNQTEYVHNSEGLGTHHAYLLPSIDRFLGAPCNRSIFEIGFGNGSVANHFASNGFKVSGIEPSHDGVRIARKLYPHLDQLHQGNAYEPLAERYGTFSIVISLEVIEHVYAPRKLVASAYSLLKPGGILILSTPYHGYLKNIAIALTGKFDFHVHPLRDHGHIKFWSIKTLGELLREGGFDDIRFMRVGRIPPLAKSMISVARRPDHH